jgi:predicted transcriptional regulator
MTMKKVADVLDHKYPQFNTVLPDCLVSDALYQMSCENVDYLIVLEDDKFLGILSEHDIATKVLFAPKPLNQTYVREFMSSTLPIVSETDSIEHCMQIIERYNAHHIIVYDRFAFKGVITAHDLMKQALNGKANSLAHEENFEWNY